MQQQVLLLEDEPDDRLSHFSVELQQAALELMAALILHVHTSSEHTPHDPSTDRR